MENIIWTNDVTAIESLMEDDPSLVWDTACEMNADFLDDEKANLNIEIGDEIVVIADLGLWYGRRPAYKLLNSTNIKDCLTGAVGDCTTWFVDDRGDMWCRDIHHDGTNLYLYRAWKSEISQAQKNFFVHKIISGKATRKDVNRYTRRIGDYVADIYGWKVRGR